ncbi:hypothetical protein M434DRAFT_139479 [Hypoxylon sp. CO27-5]|nr:hypothetical protein M434DRAFT_139479 [Hypoxylon sp. CO27-5]
MKGSAITGPVGKEAAELWPVTYCQQLRCCDVNLRFGRALGRGGLTRPTLLTTSHHDWKIPTWPATFTIDEGEDDTGIYCVSGRRTGHFAFRLRGVKETYQKNSILDK